MFNPTNIDDVSFQATHIEFNNGKHVVEDVSKDPHEFEKLRKEKGKSKKKTTVKKNEKNNPTSSLYENK
jgi:hypothetical protein